jgi:uncharacterized hydrophobic protein (TIGR00271 family)
MIFDSQTVRLRKKTEERLAVFNAPTRYFFVLTIISAAIASCGLILDNVSIIVGAMVVAPLITPIFGFSLGFILLKWKRMGESLLSVTLGTMAAVTVAYLFAHLVMFIEGSTITLTTEILSRGESGLLYFIIAVMSGLAGAYCYAEPKISASFAGIAISVAVIPPLAVVGIGLATVNSTLAMRSLSLFGFNLMGIFLGSLFMFLILGFGKDIDK